MPPHAIMPLPWPEFVRTKIQLAGQLLFRVSVRLYAAFATPLLIRPFRLLLFSF